MTAVRRFWPALLALAACAEEPAKSAPSTSPTLPRVEATFVGRERCATCHQDAQHDWQGSHHDLAMQVADATTVLGDFADATFDYNGVTSTFSKRDGKFFARTDGPDGALHDYEIRYTFGVTPLQQYLVETERGRLQALEIAWDSRPADAGGQRWFHLYPGQRVDHRDELHWTGRQMNWNFMCASCHSTDFRRGYDIVQDRFESKWAELDVSCEACHGPGSAHVAWVENGAAASDERRGLVAQLRGPGDWRFEPGQRIASLVSSTKTTPELDTCAPCHSRRVQLDESPWQGQPLLDRYDPSLLEDRLYRPDGQILDEVYVYGSFVQSAMHHAGVTCSDCHDAHTLRTRGEGNALCARCHAPDAFDVPEHHHHAVGSDAAQCVNCHMRTRTYMGVDVRRDHSFRVPRPDESLAIGTPNACGDCHVDKGARWAANAIAAWRGDRPASPASTRPGFGQAFYDARRGAPGATDRLLAVANDVTQPAIARATALAELASQPLTDTTTLRRAFADPEPLVRRGAAALLEALPENERIALGAPLLRDPLRAVRAAAGRAFATVPPSALAAADRAAASATLQEWIAGQQQNRDQPWAHVNLGLLHADRGERAAAEAAYRTALRLDPRAVQARVNLADLWRADGDDARGEALLREGLTVDPRAADVRHALGLALVRLGRREEGIAELQRVAEEHPDNARFAYVYGIALSSSGAPDRAFAVLDAALQRHPFDGDILYALATMLRDTGEVARAVPYAERLVQIDPSARALLDELRRAGR
ncbi:MAG: tetratricopeptide repeat protein [Planctomycetota bacterium]